MKTRKINYLEWILTWIVAWTMLLLLLSFLMVTISKHTDTALIVWCVISGIFWIIVAIDIATGKLEIK